MRHRSQTGGCRRCRLPGMYRTAQPAAHPRTPSRCPRSCSTGSKSCRRRLLWLLQQLSRCRRTIRSIPRKSRACVQVESDAFARSVHAVTATGSTVSPPAATRRQLPRHCRPETRTVHLHNNNNNNINSPQYGVEEKRQTVSNMVTGHRTKEYVRQGSQHFKRSRNYAGKLKDSKITVPQEGRPQSRSTVPVS